MGEADDEELLVLRYTEALGRAGLTYTGGRICWAEQVVRGACPVRCAKGEDCAEVARLKVEVAELQLRAQNAEGCLRLLLEAMRR